MKRIISIAVLVCLAQNLAAQVDTEKKPSTLAFHVFYNDFKTSLQMRAISVKSIFDNGQWHKINDMQMGFGLNYLKGITSKIDLHSTLEGSSADYLYQNGSTQGKSKLLLDGIAGLNFKLLTDKHQVIPYLSTGAGISSYNGKIGFYLPLGGGLQFNLFNEAFIFANTQYRRALVSPINDHLHYSIGIGSSIGRKKKVLTPLPEEIKIPPPIIVPAPAILVQPEEKVPVKNVLVKAIDEQTGFPLPGVEVVVSDLTSSERKLEGISNADGQITFNALPAADYSIAGILNGISTNKQIISASNFNSSNSELTVSLFHNDPRFTLSGLVTNKITHSPESGVAITVVNTSLNTLIDRAVNGSFSIPLEPGSDFSISGKKASYISNIEKVSTKGLNRSTTLYVKLELEIEEALPDKVISLKNIYYDSGSSKIRANASSDLEKLVKFLQDNPLLNIEIASHSDSRGNNKTNLILSQKRAQEVVFYLTKNGIRASRLIAKGYGETQLINSCANGVTCTDLQHEQNRRTEFKVIEN